MTPPLSVTTSAPPTATTVLTLIPIATFTLRFTRHSFRFLVRSTVRADLTLPSVCTLEQTVTSEFTTPRVMLAVTQARLALRDSARDPEPKAGQVGHLTVTQSSHGSPQGWDTERQGELSTLAATR